MKYTVFVRGCLLAAILAAGSVAVAACGSENNAGAVHPESQPGMQTGGTGENPMTQVAATLGISQEQLEAAFTQARSELGMPAGDLSSGERRTLSPPGEGMTPVLPEGGMIRPSGLPQGGMSSELMAKAAAILGISQSDLENAFAEARQPQ